MAKINEIDRTTDIILLLFYFEKKVRGITKLQKILFLLQEEETKFYKEYKDKIKEKLDYEKYKMGPFTDQIYDEIQLLINIGAIKKEEMKTDATDSWEIKNKFPDQRAGGLKNKVFKITKKGEIIGEKLSDLLEEEYKKELKEFFRKYNRMSLNELLEYIYTEYEEWTEKSEIKSQVLY